MPRLDAANIKITNELAARLDAINKTAESGYSRNQLAERLLDECCRAIESKEAPTLPRTILDARSRMGRGTAPISEETFRTLLDQKVNEIRERDKQTLAKLEAKIEAIREELKSGKTAKK